MTVLQIHDCLKGGLQKRYPGHTLQGNGRVGFYKEVESWESSVEFRRQQG